jgi:methylated-DNA-[protein]-cysteine S-methyltransferase
MATPDSDLSQLQNEWKEMFQKALPAAATSKSPFQVRKPAFSVLFYLLQRECLTLRQSKWPVHVDHCFARIILDSTVGIDAPWMEKVKSPAYKNMSRQQLKNSIELGRKILNGEADLVELDNRSLELRGKGPKASGKASGKMNVNPGKRKRTENEAIKDGEEKEMKKRKSPHPSSELVESEASQISEDFVEKKVENFTQYLNKIALSTKTSFQKKVLTLLCQVPRGKYTTYSAIAKHLSSSPRAVGNALRSNPFAPHVPCHRVLATGGGLGGFYGSWGKNGKEGLHDDKKRKLLREEGVRFDGRGKVVGSPWEGFS